jgi:hypothetical protein
MKNFVGNYDVQINMDLVRKVIMDPAGTTVTYVNGDTDYFANIEATSTMDVAQEIRDALRK